MENTGELSNRIAECKKAIDAMSRDSNAPDDPRYAAKMLADSHADEDAILKII